ncbi:TetR/AcrR family transcriptional regulator [Flexivirga meconopsidis]|uniref:TetR/AcrR family transcriptional regulator n=1 Tax=Flexivirga meconopsidis TaxID=2977121 RepID=UPI00223EDDAB|nr:TetR/AcrR family transcriptional regulator [Flexivirga meconopsidis]
MKNNLLPARILTAARRVLVRDGADRLTLAAVAAEAGVTVGGVRYHYANKRALLEALVSDFVSAFDSVLAEAAGEPGARTRAYIDGTFATTPNDTGEGTAPTAGILAAIAVDTDLLQPLRAHYDRWQRLLDADGLRPEVSMTIRLAMDGYWAAATLGLAAPDKDLSGDVQRYVIELLDRELGRADA